MPSPDLPKSSSSTNEKFYIDPELLKKILKCPDCNLFECLEINNKHIYVCPECGSSQASFASAYDRVRLRHMYARVPNFRVEECCFGQLLILEKFYCQSCNYRRFQMEETEKCKKQSTSPVPAAS